MTSPLAIARSPRKRAALPRLAELAALYRQRRALAQLDPARLADIGVSASEAQQEAARPFWDVPCHWLR
ncbi:MULTISPECIES: DUF1127 domain-containing protein [unclassified Marinovum]